MSRYPFFALGILAILAACSSSSSTTGTPAAADGGTEAAAAGDATTGADASNTDSAAAPGDCGDEAKYLGCVQCCETVHSAGAAEYYKDVAACGCKPELKCNDVCKDTICAATPVRGDAACTACLTGIQAKCIGELQASCGSDKGCVSFVSCFSAAGCDKKPQ